MNGLLPREVGDLFHKLRKLGNAAAHEGTGNHAEAISGLRFARQLAVWFHRAYGKQPDFRPGPFVPPGDPEDSISPLKGEIETLRQKLIETERSAELARQATEAETRARESLEARLQREAEERAVWEQLAAEAEAARVVLAGALSARQPSPEVLHEREVISRASTGVDASTAARLVEVQHEAEQAPRGEELALLQRGEEAASQIDLDEAETRAPIDRAPFPSPRPERGKGRRQIFRTNSAASGYVVTASGKREGSRTAKGRSSWIISSEIRYLKSWRHSMEVFMAHPDQRIV